MDMPAESWEMPLAGERSLELRPRSAGADFPALVDRARLAQRRWAGLSLADRARRMRRAAREMLRRRNEVIALCREDIGKLDTEGLFSEALGPVDQLAGWTSVIARFARRRRVRLNPLSFPKKSAWTDFSPRGIVGVIAPWNYPLANNFRSLFPALLCGNGVILKPSEHAPATGRWVVEVVSQFLPYDLLQLAEGDGAVGWALVESGIDACVFTGSVATGRKVATRCAELGIPASVELGGNDPAIVLMDADLERATQGITHWALHNAGQACGAVELALVDLPVADELVARLRSAWSRLRVASGVSGEAEVAPLANQHQLEVVQEHVEDALAAGAELVTGGHAAGEGLAFQPTVLDHCTRDMRVVQEETFGPVLAVVRVDGADAAIRFANSLPYGLTASIWSRDFARAERLAERLDYGTVTINNHSFTGAIPALPWSGTRNSGTGIANSELSLLTFLRPKAVAVDRASAPELFWMPFDRDLWHLGDILADVMLGHVERVFRLPGIMRRRRRTVRSFFRER